MSDISPAPRRLRSLPPFPFYLDRFPIRFFRRRESESVDFVLRSVATALLFSLVLPSEDRDKVANSSTVILTGLEAIQPRPQPPSRKKKEKGDGTFPDPSLEEDGRREPRPHTLGAM